MMDDRRARLIAEVVKHLEGLDADELGGKMKPMEGEGQPDDKGLVSGGPGDKDMGEKGPMEIAVMAKKEGSPEEEMSESPAEEKNEDDMDDEDLEELSKLSK